MIATAIRSADATGPADAAACASIYAPYVEGSVISFEASAPSPARIGERMAEALRTHAWFVAERDGAVVGYAYAHAFAVRAAYRWSCETSIYLHPEHRGTGVGRLLYTALLDRLIARGYRTALAGMTLPNAASESLHRAMGFEPVGVYRNIGWKHGAWRDVAWFQKDLGRGTDEPSEPT